MYQCRDLSDEIGCPPRTACPETHFACASGSLCVDPRGVCDSVRDCPGGEDEFDCRIMSFEPEFECCDGARRVSCRCLLHWRVETSGDRALSLLSAGSWLHGSATVSSIAATVPTRSTAPATVSLAGKVHPLSGTDQGVAHSGQKCPIAVIQGGAERALSNHLPSLSLLSWRGRKEGEGRKVAL